MKKLLTILCIFVLYSCEPIMTKYNTPNERNYVTTEQLEKVAKADTSWYTKRKVVELDNVVYVFNQDNKLVMKVNTQIDTGTNWLIAIGFFALLIAVLALLISITNKLFN